MEITYLAGLTLGLALIAPIGAQNVFIIGQGLAVGWPQAGWAVIAAGSCDTLLILAGAAGASSLLTGFPMLRAVLLLAGTLFLGHLGLQSWRSNTTTLSLEAAEVLSVTKLIRRTMAVSLLNPHAILDTVGVIGAAVASQPYDSRVLFASGTVSASWLWFLLLAVGGATARRHLTPYKALWVERISGTIMILFGVFLLHEFIQIVIA